MKRIVFLGAKDIGLHCLAFILKSADHGQCELLAFGGNSRLQLDERFSSLLEGRSVELIRDPDQLLDLEYDLLISVQYDRMLTAEHLKVAQEVNINLHMAPLPEYRGCNQFTFAILDRKKEFGTSLHMMVPQVDAGDILFERRFEMKEEEWVKNLYERTLDESKLLFSAHWNQILASDYSKTPQADFQEERSSSFHLRNEIDQVKSIDATWPIERQKLHFRASFFPPFEPPKLIENGEGRSLDMNWYEKLK